MMASAASVPPSLERADVRTATEFSMGSMGSTWPITPVDATKTSSWGMPSSLAASRHILSAFSTPSALQVLALPELAITA